MMIAEGFTCQRYGFNVGADKFSLLTIENGKTSIMRLSEWTLISQSQKSHSDRLLEQFFDRSLTLFPSGGLQYQMRMNRLFRCLKTANSGI